MTGYDGYVTIGTKLDTSGMDGSIKGLQKNLEGRLNTMGNTMTKTLNWIKAGIIGAGLAVLFKSITNQLDEAVSRVDTLNNFSNVMSNLGISSEEATQAINYMSDKLMGLPTKLDDAALSVQRLASANGNIKASTEMFLAMNNAILAGGANMQLQSSALEQLSQAYAKGKPDMMEWRTMLMAMPAQLKQVATVMGYASSNALGEALRDGSVSMNEFMITLTKMNREGLHGFKSLEEQAANATGGIRTSLTNLKTAISRGLANIMNEIGQTNIAGFFQRVIKVINTATNYIAAFVRVILTAINAIAKLFGGKTTKGAKDTKKDITTASGAMEDLADNTDDATGKAKGLNKQLKQLAAFDEMNVLQDKSSSGGSGGSGSGGGAGSADLSAFDIDWGAEEESQIDKIYKKMMEFFGKIGDWLSQFDVSPIIDHIKSIGTTLKEIFTDPGVLIAFDNWKYHFINALETIATSAIQIGINIAEFLVGSIDTYLLQNKDRIKDHLKAMLTISADSWDLLGEISEIFSGLSDVLATDVSKQIGADIIAMFANPLMSVMEIVGKAANDFVDLFVTPIRTNLEELKTAIMETLTPLETGLHTIADAATYIGDSLNAFYDNSIHPLVEKLKRGWSDTFGKLIEVYRTHIVPVLDEASKDVKDIWENHLKPLWDNIMGFLGEVYEIIMIVYEQAVKPLIDWIIQNVIPVLVPIFNQIRNVFSTVFKIIVDILSGFFAQLKNVMSFIKNVLKGDWKAAWESIKSLFTTPWNTMKKILGDVWTGIKNTIKNGLTYVKNIVSSILGTVKSKFSTAFNGIWSIVRGVVNKILGGIEKMCNGVIRGINNMFGPLAKVGNKVLSAVGISGFSFSTIPTVSLPRLAKGGIVNLPGKGVPVGAALTGEVAPEGVIPLTDAQQMALLGEAIGKYITINANIVNTMNGRVISRELQKIQKESDFAFNR